VSGKRPFKDSGVDAETGGACMPEPDGSAGVKKVAGTGFEETVFHSRKTGD
jgi:hypothetical protein